MEKHGHQSGHRLHPIAAIEQTGTHYSVQLSSGNHIPADKVMFATGRVPNVRQAGTERSRRRNREKRRHRGRRIFAHYGAERFMPSAT